MLFFFASRGAKVVVNDLGGSLKGQGASAKVADQVVEEIKKNGGTAVANYDSVENGEKIIETAVKSFGKVDILINNAGILRDSSFMKMTTEAWNTVLNIHLHAVFTLTQAAWKIMREQKFGRIINVSSKSGIYGSFGQANYAAAKMAILGFTQTLAKEGVSRNIHVNCIAPLAASRMTETIMKQEELSLLDPKHVVPLVAYLCHDTCKENGSCFELGGGYIGKIRLERTQGVLFEEAPEAEDVRNNIQQIVDFKQKNDYPVSFQDVLQKLLPENKGKLKPNNMKAVLKSDKIFREIREFLSKGKGAALTKETQAIFKVEVVRTVGSEPLKTWIIDLKNGQGKAIEGDEAAIDVTFSIVDDTILSIWNNTTTPQQAFSEGKLDIKGNIRLASKLKFSTFKETPKPSL